MAEDRAPWAIPWPCINVFFAIVTHPRIYNPPTLLETAIDQVEAWLESPTLVMLSESEDYWRLLCSTLQSGRISGPQVHGARIVTICHQHGVRELWTADRDFGRFPGLAVRNPLISWQGQFGKICVRNGLTQSAGLMPAFSARQTRSSVKDMRTVSISHLSRLHTEHQAVGDLARTLAISGVEPAIWQEAVRTLYVQVPTCHSHIGQVR